MQPLVSVIIPAYNCADYIEKSIDSALMQGVSLEILVINDCSKDHLDEVMQQYQNQPEIVYLHNVKNLGASGTRNFGISQAKGKYIAFLDADDFWAPEKLKKQFAAMKREHVVLCATARELMTPEGVCTGRIIPVKEKIYYRDLLKQNCINCSSVLMRTEVAREFPMHHEDSHEDYIMWLEILKKYKKACAVNEPLLKYRLSNTGKSGNKWNSAKMTYKVYRYVGFGRIKAMCCFCSYAVHGAAKYLTSYINASMKK